MTAHEGIGIVVIFYRPDDECVQNANRLVGFGLCVVVDNTEQARSASELGLDGRILYVPNGQNRGIATAINQGVERLIAENCTTALLFDQDSDPSPELLTCLPKLLEAELQGGARVAVIGPAYEDSRLGGVVPFVRFGWLKLRRIQPTGFDPIEVDFLITSGSCLNLMAWRDIGPMEDTLFIDFVDLEWCARACSKGYAVLGAPRLRLVHALGGEPLRIFGRSYPGHSPVRHYYMFRNAIALIKRNYIPWSWKSTELVKFPVRLVLYALFMRPRRTHFHMAILGIWHGLTGRTGAL